MGNAPREIGTRIKMGNRPDTYQVTRIEPNGLCFGVHIDFLEAFKLEPNKEPDHSPLFFPNAYNPMDDAIEINEGTGEPDEDEPWRQDAIDDYYNRLESDKS